MIVNTSSNTKAKFLQTQILNLHISVFVITRKEVNNLKHMVIRKVDGKRLTGCSTLRYTDQIRTALDANLQVALHSAKERKNCEHLSGIRTS